MGDDHVTAVPDGPTPVALYVSGHELFVATSAAGRKSRALRNRPAKLGGQSFEGSRLRGSTSFGPDFSRSF